MALVADISQLIALRVRLQKLVVGWTDHRKRAVIGNGPFDRRTVGWRLFPRWRPALSHSGGSDGRDGGAPLGADVAEAHPKRKRASPLSLFRHRSLPAPAGTAHRAFRPVARILPGIAARAWRLASAGFGRVPGGPRIFRARWSKQARASAGVARKPHPTAEWRSAGKMTHCHDRGGRRRRSIAPERKAGWPAICARGDRMPRDGGISAEVKGPDSGKSEERKRWRGSGGK